MRLGVSRRASRPSDDAPAAQELDQHQNERDDRQNVNEGSHAIAAHETEQTVYGVRAAFAGGAAGFPLSPEKDSGSCTSGRSIENTHPVPGMLRT